MEASEGIAYEQEKLVHQGTEEYCDFIVNNEKYCPNNLQLKDIEEDVNWIYSKANLEKPKFIFIARSYLEEKLMINYILTNGFNKYSSKWIWNKIKLTGFPYFGIMTILLSTVAWSNGWFVALILLGLSVVFPIPYFSI